MIDRYELVMTQEDECDMVRREDGDYVSHDDHIAALEAVKATGPASEDQIDILARRIYEGEHKRMSNVWAWDDQGLDDEHPDIRKRFRRYAKYALEAKDQVIETLRAALTDIANYYEQHFVEGEIAYQAALVARRALEAKS